MGLFDDSTKLFNRSFPWGLGRFRPEIDSNLDALEDPPPDIDSISVYVDDDGNVNMDEPLVLYKQTDPIRGGIDLEFSKDNLFVEALEKALDTFPLYGIILYPIRNPANPTEGFMEPPSGFVPCAGQLLVYGDGTELRIPRLTSYTTTSGAGDGASTSQNFFAPYNTAYIMKVPPGWVRTEPENLPTTLNNYGPVADSIFSDLFDGLFL